MWTQIEKTLSIINLNLVKIFRITVTVIIIKIIQQMWKAQQFNFEFLIFIENMYYYIFIDRSNIRKYIYIRMHYKNAK